MEFDDDRLDDGPGSPLLPPDDRLWRHPSEAGSQPSGWAHSAGGGNRHAGGPSIVTVAALTSSITALLTLGLVLAIRSEPVRPVADDLGATFTGAGGISGVAELAAVLSRVRPSIVRVEADRADGVARASGVFMRADGMVVTSNHVVAGASAIQVLLHDGRRLPARVLGGDPDTDLALVDLEGDGFEVASFGSASRLQVGDPAITLGASPDQASGPMAMGVVSGLGRHVETRGVRLVDMIETDTPLAPGCSGGALLDRTGAVVGIAAANASTPAGVVGYATPIEVARGVAEQLASKGAVSRGWLGIEGDDLAPALAAGLGLEGAAVVVRVAPGSPAAAAGLAPADVITSVDGQPVRSMAALMVAVRARRVGDAVTLTVIRDGAAGTVGMTLAERPAARP